jgi:hypothetical protein
MPAWFIEMDEAVITPENSPFDKMPAGIFFSKAVAPFYF